MSRRHSFSSCSLRCLALLCPGMLITADSHYPALSYQSRRAPAHTTLTHPSPVFPSKACPISFNSLQESWPHTHQCCVQLRPQGESRPGQICQRQSCWSCRHVRRRSSFSAHGMLLKPTLALLQQKPDEKQPCQGLEEGSVVTLLTSRRQTCAGMVQQGVPR